MFSLRRVLSILLFAAVVATSTSAAEAPWGGKPFAADPKSLVAAAEAVDAHDSDVVILIDDTHYSIEADGRAVSTHRQIYRIVDESAIENWSTIQEPWSPWFQKQPKVEARVITRDGAVHRLDTTAVTESAAREESLDIFSDNRLVRAPLPAVAVGSVVEIMTTREQTSPLAGMGVTGSVSFGSYVPMQGARLVIDTAPGVRLRLVNETQPRIEPVRETAGDRQIVTFQAGPFTAKEDYEGYLPSDITNLPYVAFSTGSSWQEIARGYSEVVDRQIASAPLQTYMRDAIGTARTQRDIVAHALAYVEKNVRYAGVEVGESSIVPRAPQSVLFNRYGDCKDKATLLVALLRSAGLKANVALLRAGRGFDVRNDLPGLGMFNHAIVIVEGAPPMWVDPTDEFARAGEIPTMDEGRMALIAKPSTVDLTLTPVGDASAHFTSEERLFTLSEEGPGSVVETTTAMGAEEASLRRYYATSDRKGYREAIENYAKRYYSAKSLKSLTATDAHDLEKPFRITLEAAEASRGFADESEAVVAVMTSGLLQDVPWSLREVDRNKEEKTAEEKEKARRKHDFVFDPFVKEWRYTIVPATGFAARTLPENESLQLGTATYSQKFTSRPDGAVLATFRFDSGKRRLTPAEFTDTRKKIAEFSERPTLLIGFDNIGMAQLTAGNVKAALAAFQKSAAVHPKEARHQTEIARALIVGGLADSAREQIKRAIALEPNYAGAHRVQGMILQFDSLGRPYRKGADYAGAIAAYRKAVELDPKNVAIHAELAKLLEFGEEGLLFGRNAHAKEAVVEYTKLIDEFGEEDYVGELIIALAYAGDFDQIADRASKTSDTRQQNVGKVLAAVAKNGPAAGIREASSLNQTERKEVLRKVGSILLGLRRYEQAGAMLEEANQGSTDADALGRIALIRKGRRIEEMPFPKDDPATVIKRFTIDTIVNEMNDKRAAQYFSSLARELPSDTDEASSWTSVRNSILATARQQGLPLEFYAEIGLSGTRFVQDGSEETGLRIRSRSTGSDEETYFVVRENGEYRIAATTRIPTLIGSSVLQLVDAGKTDAARQWLNWARDEFPSISGDDPLLGLPFSGVWPRNKQNATPDEIRLAAATLMLAKGVSQRAVPILNAAREKTTDVGTRLQIDHALLIITRDEDPARSLELAQRIHAAAPESPSGFEYLCRALTQAQKPDEVVRIAKERLARIPNDDTALRELAAISMYMGRYDESDRFFRELSEKSRPTSADFNNMAWNALLGGRDAAKALEDARQASQNTGGNSALLHTIAALYAEVGNNNEARQMLLRSMDEAGADQPESHDWYVLGRIAENYGVNDAALAAYKKVEKPKTDDKGSTWVLAARRLAKLNGKPKS